MKKFSLRTGTIVALLIFALATLPRVLRSMADSKPNVQLNVDNARPRPLEDSTQAAILRDYTSAWQAINTALANNNTASLNDNFTGFALEKLTQRVKDQSATGIHTRIIDHGHRVAAIFYSRDGSAVELRDNASIETQLLDGNTLLHSDNAQVQYIAVMTSAADRWQVRMLESVPGDQGAGNSDRE